MSNGHNGHDESQYHIDPVEWGEQRQLIKEIHNMVKIQNGRVRRLENWRWYIIGIFTAIMLVVDKLMGYLK